MVGEKSGKRAMTRYDGRVFTDVSCGTNCLLVDYVFLLAEQS